MFRSQTTPPFSSRPRTSSALPSVGSVPSVSKSPLHSAATPASPLLSPTPVPEQNESKQPPVSSTTYKRLFPQPFCFHILTNAPGGCSLLPILPPLKPPNPISRQTTPPISLLVHYIAECPRPSATSPSLFPCAPLSLTPSPNPCVPPSSPAAAFSFPSAKNL